METIFLLCAIVGGTVLVIQFALSLVGLDANRTDVDIVDDLPDGDVGHHSSTWLFSIISFKTVVAALAFFGIGGMAARTGGIDRIPTLFIALICGGAAMVLVHFLMRSLYKLNEDGNLRVERAVGSRGTVYVPIPGGKAGAGKVQLKLQNRIAELHAMTAEQNKLPTGARVVVVGIISSNTVEVELVPEVVETREA